MRAHSDEVFMRECLRLAAKGRGHVSPNPMVGAVVVKAGRIVGRGYHKRFGSSHAEIEAIRKAGGRAVGATLYVNLEPCCHFGKTPPCTDAIVRAKIRRVVCAVRDPNSVARGGIEKLKRAGIVVSIGCMEKEARELNETFFTFHEKRRPFVALKFAASLDGKLATASGDSKWITNEKARAYARKLRGEYQAVLVGVNTILKDDPHLGVRWRGMRDPLRVVLDSTLRVPFSPKFLRDSNVLIVTTRRASERKKRSLEARGVTVHVMSGSRLSIKELLRVLQKMNIISVLVEGGGEVLGSFIDAKVADKVYAFYAPILIGGKEAVSIGGEGARSFKNILRFSEVSIKSFGDNFFVAAIGTS